MESDFLGKKRDRLEEEENDVKIKVEENNDTNVEIKTEPKEKEKEVNNISSPYSNSKTKDEKKQKEEKNQYPNLSAERGKYLKSLIDKLEISSHTEFSDKNFSPEEKSRKTFRNGILYALVISLM